MIRLRWTIIDGGEGQYTLAHQVGAGRKSVKSWNKLILEVELMTKKNKWGVIELEYSNDILCLRPVDDMHYELEDLIEFQNSVFELTDGQPHFVLSDFRDHHLRLSNETMKYAARNPELNAMKIAEAVVVNTLSNLLVARFFVNVVKPLKPTKIFKSREKAMEWLEKIKAGQTQEH